LDSANELAIFALALVKYRLFTFRFSENGNIFISHLLAFAVANVDSTLSSTVEKINGSVDSFFIESSENCFLLNFWLTSANKNADSTV